MDEGLEDRLTQAMGQLRPLPGRVKLDLGDEGIWLLDARSLPPSLERSDDEAECTIRATASNLLKLMDGKLDPMLAYGLGKIKVKGDMGLAMKLVAALT